MKKSNKVTAFYVLSSILLFAALIFGGVYGIYVSSGVNFMGSTMNNIPNTGNAASNVSMEGSLGVRPSMSGIVILSIILIIISVLDFVSLIKQIIFFKQFKLVRESSIEAKIEKKVKSKGSVVFFTILIDLISLGAGIAGLFLNTRSFVRNGILWVLYLIDGIIVLFSLLSFVLLIIKLKQNKNLSNENKNAKHQNIAQKNSESQKEVQKFNQNNKIDLEDIEYNLLKLKTMRSSKMITQDEFNELRKQILPTKKSRSSKNNYWFLKLIIIEWKQRRETNEEIFSRF